MKALIIIDMQRGMFTAESTPYDIDGVVERINRLAKAMRDSAGLVVFVQHRGPTGDAFAEGQPGWEFLDSLDVQPADCIVAKTICDSFYGTNLEGLLEKNDADELFITGWATDFCVDTTVRSAGSRGYNISVVSDAHTAADREHLNGQAIIRHHNAIWSQMDVVKSPIRVVAAAEVVDILTK